jgi:chemotaxis protein MotB
VKSFIRWVYKYLVVCNHQQGFVNVGIGFGKFAANLHHMMSLRPVLLVAIVAATLASCVSSKVHNELLGKYAAVSQENNRLLLENQDRLLKNEDLTTLSERLKNKYDQLVEDTASLQSDLRRLQRNYNDLNRSYEFLLENNNTLLATNARENRALLEQLEQVQVQLTQKQDSLAQEQQRMDEVQTKLQAREAKLLELESLIAKKDSTNGYVQKQLSEALLGFEGKGLSVEMRNGLVYVSLENSLLFRSGSWTVETRGQEALSQLAKVLAENKDLRINVEGHTDSDAFRGGGQVRDNWDLSVMRATSVVKILTENKGIDPLRISASGRGEFLPLATNETTEGKAKNRRTEIILTPNLEGLLELIGNQ